MSLLGTGFAGGAVQGDFHFGSIDDSSSEVLPIRMGCILWGDLLYVTVQIAHQVKDDQAL